jgi:hypothetical protein
MKCASYTQAHCDAHPACAKCPAEDRKRNRTWWQERAEALRKALAAAASSLEWIATRMRELGEDNSDRVAEIRAYAQSRAAVARDALEEESDGYLRDL